MVTRARLGVLLPIIRLDLNLRRRLKEEKMADARRLQKEAPWTFIMLLIVFITLLTWLPRINIERNDFFC